MKPTPTVPTDSAARLERRYRSLLRAYPAAYRDERGDELIVVLMSAAEPRRRRPSLGDTVDLVRHGLRTRVTFARCDLGSPIATRSLRRAGWLMLAVAAAVAVAVATGVAVLGYTVFPPGRKSNESYSAAVRIGVAVMLGVYPVGLVFGCAGRSRIARHFATFGALGSVTGAVMLAVHATRTRTEHVDGSPLFGLVLILCLPAVLLWVGRAGVDDRDRANRRHALGSALLTGALVCVVAANEMFAPSKLGAAAFSGTRSLFDTGLEGAIAVALGVIAIWSARSATIRRNDPEPRVVAWALSIPVAGAALGVLLSPVIDTSGIAFEWQPAQVAWFGATVALLAVLSALTLSSARHAAVRRA